MGALVRSSMHIWSIAFLCHFLGDCLSNPVFWLIMDSEVLNPLTVINKRHRAFEAPTGNERYFTQGGYG